MKSLSDDITIKLPTTGMVEGYVTTQIYVNSFGVFSGRSYIPGDDSSLYVNVNDIAVQNRGKDDYLKLNDNGLLESVPLRNGSYGSQTIHSRFVEGQISSYSVTISDGNVQHNSQEWVLTGYDYPDRDIRPSMIDNDSESELGRIMQGCNWYRNHDGEIGVFRNLLIPHFPNVATQKYGLGLQLYIEGRRDNFALRTHTGNEVILGFASNKSNMTFMTLQDVRVGMGISYDHDTSIYLKAEGSSGDEFGDWEQEPNVYLGTCPVAILDRCYSRYYLAWNDRYGDIQSQPFDGKIEYTEDIEKTEIKDYKMRRRVIHNELQPKWKLNTKWLNEDVYPMYESIFTSPYLLLYDTQTDRSWNVIVTDNKYTEKTYKNQKALFNLEITVEANTKENRIF